MRVRVGAQLLRGLRGWVDKTLSVSRTLLELPFPEVRPELARPGRTLSGLRRRREIPTRVGDSNARAYAGLSFTARPSARLRGPNFVGR